MIFKYENKEIEVPDDFILKCGTEAAKRGMTLEEYIAEAFTMLKNQKSPMSDPYDNDEYSRSHDEIDEWGYDANGSPVK